MSNKMKKKRRPLPAWIKITGTVLKISMVPFLCLAALFAGLMFGYVYMGGQDASDVLESSTWKHLVDLVFKD